MKIKKKGKSGITLIALVITIVVLLILAAITINLIAGENSLFEKAREAKYKDKMAGYRDISNIWVSSKLIETQSTDMKTYNAGEPLKDYIDMVGADVSDITKEEVIYEITQIIPEIEKEDKEKVVVYKGEMYYVKIGNSKKVQKEAQWCTDISIKILELKKPSSVVIRDGSYQLVNGMYMCTPYLTEGFDKLHTRYVKEVDGAMTPGTFIFNNPDEDWYSYSDIEGEGRKWANIVTENKGVETYFTWIPRYCYKIDTDGKKTDVKFISTDNTYQDPSIKYFDEEGNRIKEAIAWSELEEQGYVIPEAFSFGEEGNKQDLPGFWCMKYILGESLTSSQGGSVISFTRTSQKGTIVLKSVRVNESAPAVIATPITKYTVSLNGYIKFIVEGSEVANIASKEFSFDKKQLKPGDNVLNITALNTKGEMVGSYTDIYSVSTYNAPDLGKDLKLKDGAGNETGKTGAFNKDTTFYVTYDASGNEHSNIPISQPAPAGWYDYDSSEWANIVVRNNGAETYYTWIPRYQYQIDGINNTVTIKFIQGTDTTVDAGYVIPEAFTFGGKQLTGFWSMKYMIGESSTAILEANVTTGANYIKIDGITGTAVAEGQKYNYYIDGQLKETKTKATDVVEIGGLTTGKTYILLVEVRDSSDSLVGTVAKQVNLITANAPDLGKDLILKNESGVATGRTGAFNKETTFYVTYDASGKENSSIPISEPPPDNWYDYTSNKWANIVVKGSGTSTYFTWIPRYKYQIDSNNKKTNIEFIKDTDGTSGTTDGVWTIPEAFKFGSQELKGFWAMKYMIGE